MNILYKIIQEKAQEIPDKIAVTDRKGSVTYGVLWKRICSAADILCRNGMKRESRVVISADSSVDFAIIFIAVQASGGISIPIDRSLRGEKAEELLRTADADIFISLSRKKNISTDKVRVMTYADITENITEEFREFDFVLPNEDETAEIIFTTGTTGKPKGAVHTYRSISANIQMTYDGVGIKSDDVILIPIALSHSYGLRVFRSALYAGAEVVLQNGALFFDELERNIRKNHCTGLAYITVGIEMMLSQLGEEKTADILGGLRYIEFSAGALPLNMRQRLCVLLKNTDILNTWGSTETGGALFINVSKDKNTYSAGRTINGAEAAIADADGNISRKNNISGRLALKGEMVMSEYIGAPELTEAVFHDGWLLTGDIVSINEDGYVLFEGRADDIINCGGEKISPSEIEHTALGYGDIEEAVCVGVRDDMFGEVPVIYIKPMEDRTITVDEIKKHMSRNLEHMKLPRDIIITDNIPHNSMGKIERKKLKAMYERQNNNCNPVISAILGRRSVRDFTEETVPEDIVRLLAETGTAAPSGRNTRTRMFTVISDRDEIRSLKELTGRIAAREKTSFHGFGEPPLMILISNERRNKDGIQDAACAAENIMIACHSLGLGSVWLNPLMNICDTAEIRERLDQYGIPRSYIVWAALAIGYPSGKIPDFVRKEESIIYIGGKTNGNK